MSYILMFKTKKNEKRRIFFAIIYPTLEEANNNKEKLIKEGYNGEKVIHTTIQEGREDGRK